MRKFLPATTLALSLSLAGAAFAQTGATYPPPVTSPNLYDEAEPRANARPAPGTVAPSPDARWDYYNERNQLAYDYYATPPYTTSDWADRYEDLYGTQ